MSTAELSLRLSAPSNDCRLTRRADARDLGRSRADVDRRGRAAYVC